MRWKHWCDWSAFQSCVPGFKGHPLVLRLRMGSQLSWRFPSEGFSYEADSLSALLSTYVRSLAFTLVRVAFLLSAQLSWLYLCSKNWNAVSQQSLDEALLRDMAGTVLLKSRHGSYITPLITSSPGAHHPVPWGIFQQQWLLAVLRNFPQKRLFSCCCL